MKVEENTELEEMLKKIEKFFEEYPISPLYEGATDCPVCGEQQQRERFKAEKEKNGEGYWITPFFYCVNCGNYYFGKKYWRSKIEGIDLGKKKGYGLQKEEKENS